MEDLKSGKDKKFEAMLREEILHRARLWGHGDPPTYGFYRASQLPYCGRKISLDILLEERAETNGAMLAGQAVHHWFAELMRNIVESEEEEVYLDFGDFSIVGHYDLVLNIDGKRYVADVKSTTRKNFSRIPSVEHIKQLSIYQKALGEIDGLLIYLARDDFDVQVFRFPFIEELYQEMVEKATAIHELLNYWEVYPRKEEKDWECVNKKFKCRYYDYCWNMTEEELLVRIKEVLKSNGAEFYDVS